MSTARLPATVVEPAGLFYEAETITGEEEADLISHVEALDFREVVMRGQTAKRTVRHFGFDYGYESWQLVPGDPLPDWLLRVRDEVSRVAGVNADEMLQALVSRYPPGAGIGWHRDAPMFGSPVVGLSLGSPCRMRFQRKLKDARETYDLRLEPRSTYALDGASRWAWQHSIPATDALRYSITFRSVKNPDRWPAPAAPGAE
jgi:alkylated DNA repair protein (DNA oxidative demethylase)